MAAEGMILTNHDHQIRVGVLTEMLIRKHSLVHHQLRGHAGIAGVHQSHKQISWLCHDKQRKLLMLPRHPKWHTKL
ncbi:hypothetical protein ANANG_G00121690 [Anguilla anguilla]|uniref:Uncharacterized protein n=1 Tax=Anguilla anguilla TaxID=7936 RepID=A0A9D3MDL5_ANGAN|nr:hypothetical protein ANANG_G00121690 [Anguilla anguilla]